MLSFLGKLSYAFMQEWFFSVTAACKKTPKHKPQPYGICRQWNKRLDFVGQISAETMESSTGSGKVLV